VLISYGPNSSTQLFMQYGFCPPLGTNAAEAAHLAPWAAATATGRHMYKIPADPAQRSNLAVAQLPAGSLPLPALFVDLVLAHVQPEVMGEAVSPEAYQVGGCLGCLGLRGGWER
jgi:hypothetical protein